VQSIDRLDSAELEHRLRWQDNLEISGYAGAEAEERIDSEDVNFPMRHPLEPTTEHPAEHRLSSGTVHEKDHTESLEALNPERISEFIQADLYVFGTRN
jgi:hypothetical protein